MRDTSPRKVNAALTGKDNSLYAETMCITVCCPNECHVKKNLAPLELVVTSLEVLETLGSDGCKTSKLHGNLTTSGVIVEEIVKSTKKSLIDLECCTIPDLAVCL